MAGEAQEYVIQARPPEARGRRCRCPDSESLDCFDYRALALADGQLDRIVLDHGLSSLIGPAMRRLFGLLVIGERDLEPFAADHVLELVRRAVGDHSAVVDHRDPVGQAIGLVEVLGGQQHGGAVVDQVLDRLPQAEAAARVEAGGRLVEEDHRRLGDQRRGEVEPATHAAGVGAWPSGLGSVAEVEALEQLGGSLLRRGAAHPVEAADHGQVLGPGQVLVDRGVLAGEADVLAQLVALLQDVHSGYGRAAGVGLQERGQDPDRGGLAGAVGPEQAEHGSGLDFKVHSVERLDVAEVLGQPVGRDRRAVDLRAVNPGRAGLTYGALLPWSVGLD